MNFLKSITSAAATAVIERSGLHLPFTLGERVTEYDGRGIWALWDGVKRDDSTPLSIFVFDVAGVPGKDRRSLLPLAKNALRKLRTTRHPDILRFVDGVETDTQVYIATERVRPLSAGLREWDGAKTGAREEWLAWGLHRVATALSFINNQAASSHGNVRPDSVFLNAAGEWRLGGMEVCTAQREGSTGEGVLYLYGGLLPDSAKYSPPEVHKNGWSTLKDLPTSAPDAYAFALLLSQLYNPSSPLPLATSTAPPAASSRGKMPPGLFAAYRKLLNPSPKARPSLDAFLTQGTSPTPDGGFFVNNALINICEALEQFALMSDNERTSFIRTLASSLDALPPAFATHKVLPALVGAVEFSTTVNAAPLIVPLIIQIGKSLPEREKADGVVKPLVRLWASQDRGTRMVLLEGLEQYVDGLDNKVVVGDVWPHLTTGFNDTVAVIREATIKAIPLIAPKLTDRLLNNDLLRHLAKMQLDPEPAIRTNTCILIGRLAPTLGVNTKRKVLVPAFARALRDSFVHARMAGLMALMATVDIYERDDLAAKVIPNVAPSLVDKEKLVRDQAFKALALFIKKLESLVASMPETVQQPGTEAGQPQPYDGKATPQDQLANSAAGAAGALAGWAFSAVTKQLAPAELHSVLGTTASTRPNSAPPIQPLALSPFLNGHPTPSLSSPPPSLPSAFSTPASPLERPVGGKALQLGATKAPTAAAAALAAFEEAEGEVANAWGSDDLIDVTADQDDWSAFETAAPPEPAPPLPNLSTTRPAASARTSRSPAPRATTRPAPPRAPSNLTAVVSAADDDDANGWGDDDSTPAPATAPPASARSTLSAPRAASSRSPSISSSTAAEEGWSSFGDVVSPAEEKKAPAPSLAGMSKEEKAAELARRREERRLRIEQLKQAKAAAAAGKS